MTFVQATTGGGGWPMSVWMTPELQPFFGGTYFPPEHARGGPASPPSFRRSPRPGNPTGMGSWNRPGRWWSNCGSTWTPGRAPARRGSTRRLLDSGFYAFRRVFDARLGGFGEAPKFPRPVSSASCCATTPRTRNQEALDMVLLTLREMAKGGIHDQLGGGFHRYSVDDHWFVPHFEKMLYDQAQLATAYLEAFQITGEAQYAATARAHRSTICCAICATPRGDSIRPKTPIASTDAAHPEEKSEGAFYIWTAAEIERAGRPRGGMVLLPLRRGRGRQLASDPHGNSPAGTSSIRRTAWKRRRASSAGRRRKCAPLAQAEGALL